VIAILLFNFYGDRMGIYILQDNEWRFLPVLTQTFFSYVPAMTVLWILTIVKDLWVIRDNRWTTASRLFTAGLQVFTMGITLAMLLGAPIVALGPEAIAGLGGMGLNAETVQSLDNTFMLGFRLVLAFALIGTGAELVKTVYQLFTQPRGLTA